MQLIRRRTKLIDNSIISHIRVERQLFKDRQFFCSNFRKFLALKCRLFNNNSLTSCYNYNRRRHQF